VTIVGVNLQGQTLTAANTLADVDGLGAISYQWKSAGANIVGTTGRTLVLAEALVGKTMEVVASYWPSAADRHVALPPPGFRSTSQWTGSAPPASSV
jgi:hypothetical protein